MSAEKLLEFLMANKALALTYGQLKALGISLKQLAKLSKAARRVGLAVFFFFRPDRNQFKLLS
mgnify:CR=1 FL=1